MFTTEVRYIKQNFNKEKRKHCSKLWQWYENIMINNIWIQMFLNYWTQPKLEYTNIIKKEMELETLLCEVKYRVNFFRACNLKI